MNTCLQCSTPINNRQAKQSGLCLRCRKRKNVGFKNISYKKNIMYCKDMAITKGGLCITESYVNADTKMIWECSKKHRWSQTPGHIRRGHWCPECANRKKHSIAECNELAIPYEGKCLSDVYLNNKSKLIWQCKNKHEWKASFKDIKEGHWCPQCAMTSSKTEEKVRSIFEQLFNKKFASVRPLWLKNNECKRSLQLDGYNEELKIAFEYDGEFHFKQHPKSKDSLDKRQRYDRIKDELCKQNNVKLIRVPYTCVTFLEQYIKEAVDEIR